MVIFMRLVFFGFICIPLHSLSAMEKEDFKCSQYSQSTQSTQNTQYSQSQEDRQYSQYSQSSYYSSSRSDSQDSRIKKIFSIEEIKNVVRDLREKGKKGRNIIAILDFHGLVVNEEEHSAHLTLKDGIIEILEYFKKEKVLFLVATAWDNFNAVIQDGIVKLGLQDLFDVNPNHTAELEYFKLGSNKTELKEFNIQGYRNGRVVALKYMWATHTPYFRQKAYAAELCYPEAEIHYMIFADDSKPNVEIFDEDSNHITQTRGENFQELILLHLENPK